MVHYCYMACFEIVMPATYEATLPNVWQSKRGRNSAPTHPNYRVATSP